MWRKQEQPKSSAPATEVAAGPALGTPKTPAAASTSSVPGTSVAAPNAAPTSVAAAVPPPAAPSAPVRQTAAASSRITGALKIKGEITGKEDLFIDAQLEGRVHIDGGTVTVGANGRATANIEAAEVVVSGLVKGSLRGRDRVHIGPTGRTNGEIVSRRVFIEAGAEVDGRVEVTRAAESPALKAAVAAGSQATGPRPVPSVQPPVNEPTAAAKIA
jgi:cytoskeletal protein CcmA (bactofilin family)